jgi:3-hydroxyacyl-[acyl-carrier-protein] dehydratase
MDTDEKMDAPATIDINEVVKKIPHRYPFLMVDRVVDVVPGASAVGIKNVSINEPFFQGHFPTRPIMPGVLIIESMAQTAAVLVVETLGPETEGKLVYFMSIDSARFRKPVTPGDSLRIHVEVQHHRGTVWKFRGEALVGDDVMAEAVYTAMIVDDT